ncbi:MAG: hypothetical protein OXI40_03025 [Chloroflexota bacterium]|nr:hypothetical protein [Chloroflexota bacterium]
MATNANFSRADGFMSRLLLIDQRGLVSAPPDEAAGTRRAENALTISLLFSGLRCLLQYALLPFLLPIIGVAAEAAVPILLLINLIAMISIFLSLRRFWTIGYKHRWSYLVVALAALTLLIAFTAYDIAELQIA